MFDRIKDPTKPGQKISPNPISNPNKQDANSKLDIASPIAQREPQTPAKKMEVADQRSLGYHCYQYGSSKDVERWQRSPPLDYLGMSSDEVL
uniref:Uncharacterized protein n=1 Tax=Cannabis sativa TaxID=3483 RepID=A0A803NK06_CANSA